MKTPRLFAAVTLAFVALAPAAVAGGNFWTGNTGFRNTYATPVVSNRVIAPPMYNRNLVTTPVVNRTVVVGQRSFREREPGFRECDFMPGRRPGHHFRPHHRRPPFRRPPVRRTILRLGPFTISTTPSRYR